VVNRRIQSVPVTPARNTASARRPGTSRAARPWRTTESGQPSSERPWLVGDIGGTNARFALVTDPVGELTSVRGLRYGGNSDLATLISDYSESTGRPRPAMACIALAGPVTGDCCRTTNDDLEFSIEETATTLGLERLHVVNDFAAQALATVSLPDEFATRIGDAVPVPGLATAVVGPGTGLGVAALVPARVGQPVVMPGEGGHVLITVFDETELEVVRAARAEGVTLTAEMVVSGPGLTRLHHLLGRVQGIRAEPTTPEDICGRALAGSDEQCEAALQVFCRFLGGTSSGVALTTGARGRIYLAGGILPRMAEFLDGSGFRARFEANPVMGPYLARIATTLITDPHPGLRGALAALELIMSESGSAAALPA